MQHKIVVTLDLDGTLLGRQNVILGGQQTLDLLQQLAQAGVALTINTGRLDHDMIAIQQQYALPIASRISQNGCVIVSAHHASAKLADKPEMLQVLAYLEQVPVRTEVNTISNRYWLTPRGPRAPKEYYDSHIITTDFHQVITFQPATEFLCLGPKADLLPIRDFVQTHCLKLTATLTSNSSLEVLPTGVSKGRALRELYPDAEIYALGDSENDQSVLDVADHSYAVGPKPTLAADHQSAVIDQALSQIVEAIL